MTLEPQLPLENQADLSQSSSDVTTADEQLSIWTGPDSGEQ